MAWIESHQDLGQHPKAKKAARLLGISLPTMIGHLHLLWWWALTYAQDGDLTGFEPGDLADAMLWEGEPEAMLAALVECALPGEAGLLERTDEGRLLIHDWDEYTGRLIEQRERAKARTRSWRAQRAQARTDDERAPYAPVMHNERITYATTVPYPTVPDQTDSEVVPREGDSSAHAREAPPVADEPPAAPTAIPPSLPPPPPIKDATVEALIDGLVAGLRQAGRWPAGREPTVAFRKQERSAARELARDGWTGDDVAACTVWLADIFDTINLRLVSGQIETWTANGRPERRGSLVPARAAPASRPGKGSIHTIMAGIADYAARNGSRVNGRGDVHAGDAQSADGVAASGARPGDGGRAVQYLPPRARGPDG